MRIGADFDTAPSENELGMWSSFCLAEMPRAHRSCYPVPLSDKLEFNIQLILPSLGGVAMCGDKL